MKALRHDIAIYSAHTSMDSYLHGVRLTAAALAGNCSWPWEIDSYKISPLRGANDLLIPGYKAHPLTYTRNCPERAFQLPCIVS